MGIAVNTGRVIRMANEKRLIDANAVIKDIDNYYHNSVFPHPGTTWLRGLELAVGLLLKTPTVDAVEVVRCKDCRHSMLWRKPMDSVIGECFIRKMNSDDEQFCMVGADDFCSYGERRTDK